MPLAKALLGMVSWVAMGIARFVLLMWEASDCMHVHGLKFKLM
jgi:hypothetical protein